MLLDIRGTVELEQANLRDVESVVSGIEAGLARAGASRISRDGDTLSFRGDIAGLSRWPVIRDLTSGHISVSRTAPPYATYSLRPLGAMIEWILVFAVGAAVLLALNAPAVVLLFIMAVQFRDFLRLRRLARIPFQQSVRELAHEWLYARGA